MEHSKRKKIHGFRHLPVKGTGGGSWPRYWRRPKTTQEKRYCFTELDWDGRRFYRAKRNKHALPNTWDDYERSSFRIRSWKYHRKTQWKIK